jgi:hypothetical protein
MSVVGDSGSAQMRQESSPTVKMLRPMLGHGTQVRQKSIGEQTSGSLVDKEQTMTDILIAIGAIATLLTMRAYFKGWRWNEV